MEEEEYKDELDELLDEADDEDDEDDGSDIEVCTSRVPSEAPLNTSNVLFKPGSHTSRNQVVCCAKIDYDML